MYAQGWPDKLRSIAWITQILTVTRTHGALLNVVDKTTLYVTHVSPRVARPNSDIATRLVIESVFIRLRAYVRPAPGVGRRYVYVLEHQKVKSVPQNAPVAPLNGRCERRFRVRSSPRCPVPDPTLNAERDRRRPSREPGNVVSTIFIGSWRLQVLWLEHGLEPGADRGAWLAYN